MFESCAVTSVWVRTLLCFEMARTLEPQLPTRVTTVCMFAPLHFTDDNPTSALRATFRKLTRVFANAHTPPGTRYLKTITTCKHAVAYNLENYNVVNGGIGSRAMRQNFNAIVTEQDMADTFLPAFRACVTDGAGAAIMCSYNAVNGVASCANADIQESVLRAEYVAATRARQPTVCNSDHH